MNKIIYLLVLIVASSVTVCHSQSCTGIQGTVTDATTGEPLPGASIRCIGRMDTGTTTDTIGNFDLVVSKNDTLLFSFIGYENKKLSVSEAKSCYMTVLLQPAAQSLNEIVIQEERLIAEEFTIRKINKLDIYTNPAAKADPILAVNSMPSATTTDESANISLRGGSPAETGVFLNNVPISDAVRYSQLNGIGTFSIFNTALVNNVQVFPGNPPLEYGNSTSGLIALQTEEVVPDKPSTMVSLTLANIGFYTSRKLKKNSSLSLFSNYQPSAAIRLVNSESLKDLKAFSSIDAGIHFYSRLPKRSSLKIFNYTNKELYKFDYAQPTFRGIFHQEKARNLTIVNFRKHIGNMEIGFNQGLHFAAANYEYGVLHTDVRLRDVFSSLHLHCMKERMEWKTGLTYDYRSSGFDGSFPSLPYANGYQYPVTHASRNDNIRNPEWYGYVKQYVGTRVVVGTGFRKNIRFNRDSNYTSYQANIHYKPAELWSVNISAGKYHKFQLPQAEANFAYIIRSYQYSLDVTSKKNKFEGSVSAFYKRSNANNITTYIYGVELFSFYRLSRKFKFQLSFTSLDAMQSAASYNKPSPYNIRYFIRGNMEYKIQGAWTVNAVFLLRQGSYYYDIESTRFDESLQVYEPIYANSPSRLPAYNIVDLTLNKIFPLTDKIVTVAFASAGNILNIRNTREYTYNFDYTVKNAVPFSQRTFYMGVIFNF